MDLRESTIQATHCSASEVLDWLDFTYGAQSKDPLLFDHFLETFPKIAELMRTFDLEDGDPDKVATLLDRGQYGYNFVMVLNNYIRIMYNDQESRMGVHVSIPSHGLWMLPLFGGNGSAFLSDILEDLYRKGCKVTRMDIAADDYQKVYMPIDYVDFYRENRIRTYCRRFQYIGCNGGTVYLGSRNSGRYVRIYDKNKESKGEIDAIRYELEFRGHYAQMVVDKLLSGEEFSFMDLMLTIFQIVPADAAASDRPADKSNASIDPEWLSRLAHVSRIVMSDLKLPRDRVQPTLKSAMRFLRNATAGYIPLLCEQFGKEQVINLILSFQRPKDSEKIRNRRQMFIDAGKEFDIDDLLQMSD